MGYIKTSSSSSVPPTGSGGAASTTGPVQWQKLADDLTQAGHSRQDIDNDVKSAAATFLATNPQASVQDFLLQWERNLTSLNVDAHDYNQAAQYLGDVFGVSSGRSNDDYGKGLNTFDLSTPSPAGAPPVTWQSFAHDLTQSGPKDNNKLDADLRTLASQFLKDNPNANLNDFFRLYQSQLLSQNVDAHDYNAGAQNLADVFHVDAGAASTAFSAGLTTFDLSGASTAAAASTGAPFAPSTPELGQYWSRLANDVKNNQPTQNDLKAAAKAFAGAHLGASVGDFVSELNNSLTANNVSTASLNDSLSAAFGTTGQNSSTALSSLNFVGAADQQAGQSGPPASASSSGGTGSSGATGSTGATGSAGILSNDWARLAGDFATGNTSATYADTQAAAQDYLQSHPYAKLSDFIKDANAGIQAAGGSTNALSAPSDQADTALSQVLSSSASPVLSTTVSTPSATSLGSAATVSDWRKIAGDYQSAASPSTLQTDTLQARKDFLKDNPRATEGDFQNALAAGLKANGFTSGSVPSTPGTPSTGAALSTVTAVQSDFANLTNDVRNNTSTGNDLSQAESDYGKLNPNATVGDFYNSINANLHAQGITNADLSPGAVNANMPVTQISTSQPAALASTAATPSTPDINADWQQAATAFKNGGISTAAFSSALQKAADDYIKLHPKATIQDFTNDFDKGLKNNGVSNPPTSLTNLPGGSPLSNVATNTWTPSVSTAATASSAPVLQDHDKVATAVAGVIGGTAAAAAVTAVIGESTVVGGVVGAGAIAIELADLGVSSTQAMQIFNNLGAPSAPVSEITQAIDRAPSVSQPQIDTDVQNVNDVARATQGLNPSSQAGSQEATLEAQNLQNELPNLNNNPDFVDQSTRSLEQEAQNWYNSGSNNPANQNPNSNTNNPQTVQPTPGVLQQAGEHAGLSADTSSAAAEIIGESSSAGGGLSAQETADQLADIGVTGDQAKQIGTSVGESGSQTAELSADVGKAAKPSSGQIQSNVKAQKDLLGAEATLGSLGNDAANALISKLADKVIGPDASLSAEGQALKGQLTQQAVNLGKRWGTQILQSFHDINPSEATASASGATGSVSAVGNQALLNDPSAQPAEPENTSGQLVDYSGTSLYGKSGNPSLTDVTQGSLGDCWVLATLQSVAQRNPQWIKDHIKQTSPGEYTVTLFDQSAKEVPVQVDSKFLTQSDGSLTLGGKPKALWTALYEKAAAKLASFEGPNTGYDALEGGLGASAVNMITGNTTPTMFSSDGQGSAKQYKFGGLDAEGNPIANDQNKTLNSGDISSELQNALKQNQPILFGTTNEEIPTASGYELGPFHYYSVAAFNPTDGTVLLADPARGADMISQTVKLKDILNTKDVEFVFEPQNP